KYSCEWKVKSKGVFQVKTFRNRTSCTAVGLVSKCGDLKMLFMKGKSGFPVLNQAFRYGGAANTANRATPSVTGSHRRCSFQENHRPTQIAGRRYAVVPTFVESAEPNNNPAHANSPRHKLRDAPRIIAPQTFSTNNDPVTSWTIGVEANKAAA